MVSNLEVQILSATILNRASEGLQKEPSSVVRGAIVRASSFHSRRASKRIERIERFLTCFCSPATSCPSSLRSSVRRGWAQRRGPGSTTEVSASRAWSRVEATASKLSDETSGRVFATSDARRISRALENFSFQSHLRYQQHHLEVSAASKTSCHGVWSRVFQIFCSGQAFSFASWRIQILFVCHLSLEVYKSGRRLQYPRVLMIR